MYILFLFIRLILAYNFPVIFNLNDLSESVKVQKKP